MHDYYRINPISKAQRFINHHFPRYIFIHINKTAGSSIERALKLRFEHKTAMAKMAELGEVRWNKAFKFSFVRNPWDRTVSHYHYRVQTNQTGLGDGHLDFGEWVRQVFLLKNAVYRDNELMFSDQTHWLVNGEGHLALDFIGRFETLEADFGTVLDKTGMKGKLPHLKPSNRGNYRNFYDQTTSRIIAETFSRDIENFKYTY